MKRNENIFAAFARQPLLLHKTINSYNPLVMTFPKHLLPSLCSQYSQAEILRISFVLGQKTKTKILHFSLCVFRIGFLLRKKAKILLSLCYIFERKYSALDNHSQTSFRAKCAFPLQRYSVLCIFVEQIISKSLNKGVNCINQLSMRLHFFPYYFDN